ncbi:hypothetical protein AB0E75_10460 [Streptomyces griseoviridis]|jgi:hypothetical protein|uniref:Integral membrane protein n=1 Tax=Streptomyces griseoviridis TaxID=45398 RepID=A0A918GKN5_STRGD|nr:hypothetical protein [Streptomyces niveoruber]GGS41611.1 hypothetical protein GCM10010238_33980 [Streptomyces niveoruber]
MSTTYLAVLARTREPGVALRRFLALDAAVTGANGLAYLALSGPLGDLLGAGSGLLLALGAALALYAAAVGLLAGRREPSATGVRTVVAANLAWAVLSLAALVLWLSPTTAGAVWTVAQALVVAGFALAQHRSLRERQSARP